MTATAAARCLRQKNCRNANKRLSLATLSLSLFYYYKETLSLSLSFCPLRPHGWSWPAAGHAFLLSAAARSHPECFLALHVLPVHWGGDARTVLSWRRRALSALARLVRLVPPALDAARRLRFWFCTCCGNLKKYVSADLPISQSPNLVRSPRPSRPPPISQSPKRTHTITCSDNLNVLDASRQPSKISEDLKVKP